MKVAIYVTDDPHHNQALEAFASGVPSNVSLDVRDVRSPTVADIAVVFGVGKRAVPHSSYRQHIIDMQKEAGGRAIVLETGYVRRNEYYAAGFDGLNGAADFRNDACGPARRNLLLPNYIAPPGGVRPVSQRAPILVCGQVPWDASVQDTDHRGWCASTLDSVAETTQRTVLFRAHPKAGFIPHGKTTRWSVASNHQPLDDVLRKGEIFAVVTWNSNSAVDAVLAGVPVFVCGPNAMVPQHLCGAASLDLIDSATRPEAEHVEQWLNNLAYTQWTLKEMADGQTWRHLTR